jgi:hypothetical protein
MFVIEDVWHAEWIGRFNSRDEAEVELRKLAQLTWDEGPNACPCTSWRTCGRLYHLIHFETSSDPWRVLNNEARLEVSPKGTKWFSIKREVGR